MKVLQTNISSIISRAENSISPVVCKTNPYPQDSIHLTSKFNNKKSLWQKFCALFKRKKLTPLSFSDGTSPKRPYGMSKESVNLSNKMLKNHYLSENDRIIDGFRDGGSKARFAKFGEPIAGNREIITVDRQVDTYLQNAIKYVKENTRNMNEKEKIKYIYNVIHDISGDFIKGDKNAEYLGRHAVMHDVLLGKIFEKGCATCRHKALMFKILGEEAGLKTRLIRGVAFDLGGYGKHQWNEVKLSNGKKLLVDIQNSRTFEIKPSNKNKLKGYLTIEEKPYYI